MTIEDDIYEAAFAPELWTKVLHDISLMIKAEGALLTNISENRASWFASPGVVEVYDEFFRCGWAFKNSKTAALLEIEHEGFMCDAHHFSDEWMQEQAIYRDLYWKHGFGYAVGTTLKTPTNDILGVSIEIKKGRPPATLADLNKLDSIRPHLARSTMIASRLAFAKIEVALQALEAVSLPAAMVRRDGRIVGCNDLFGEFSLHVTAGVSDKIVFRSTSAQKQFNKLLDIIVGGTFDRAQGVFSSFPIPAQVTLPAVVVHLLPIKGIAQDIFVGTAVIVVLTPVRPLPGLSIDVLRGLFDLTPAEAKIARRLSVGKAVAIIAKELDISPETVRAHVKAILLKSGMRRQTDFVASIAGVRALSKE